MAGSPSRTMFARSGSLRTMDELHRWLAAHREASLAFAPATGCPMEEGRLVSSRRPAQALIAPPGRGSLRRRTGSGAGRKNLRTAPTHERPGASAATKGTLGRAWRTLERANHALRAPDRGSDASPDSGADWRLSSKRSKLTFLSSKRTSEFTASLGLETGKSLHMRICSAKVQCCGSTAFRTSGAYPSSVSSLRR